MYLATEASEIWIPSLRSSLRILGAPQIELFRLRVRINSRVSFATLGLPTCPCRTFQVQYQRTRDGASRRLLSVSRSKAQNAIEASFETAIPINVDPSVSVWVWESFVAVRRSDVEAQGSPIGCRTECGSTRGRTKETKSTPQTWPQKPTPA